MNTCPPFLKLPTKQSGSVGGPPSDAGCQLLPPEGLPASAVGRRVPTPPKSLDNCLCFFSKGN